MSANRPKSRESLLLHLRDSALLQLKRGGALGSAIVVGAAPGLAACMDNGLMPESADEHGTSQLGSAEQDWAQLQGQRNPAMIRYAGAAWHEFVNCGSRGGCMGVDVWVKLLVSPQTGADLNQKRVGVEYRTGDTSGQSIARYFTTYQDGPDAGMEEWQAKVYLRTWEMPVFTFNAWYQDGLDHTFYDDNDGELHAASYRGDSAVIQHYATSDGQGLRVDDNGIHGKLSIVLADLDYDKRIEMVYATDGWQNPAPAFGMAGDDPNEKNKWRWVGDMWNGYERWEIDIDLPGDFTTFEYAIVYKHGVKGQARPYEYWANGGGRNYIVHRALDPQ